MNKKISILLLGIIIILFVFILLNSLIANTAENEHWIKIPSNSDKEILECVSSNPEIIELDFSLPGYLKETIIKNNKEFFKISFPDEGVLALPGKPDIPVISRLIAIPDEGSVDFTLENIKKEVIADLKVYPYQDPHNKNFDFDSKFYNSNNIYPSKIIEISNPLILRDFRVVRVTVNPFQYDPENNELHIVHNVSIKIKPTDIKAENSKRHHKKISRYFEPLYKSLILNYDKLERTEEYQRGCYLFIYPNDDYVISYLNNLIDWKHRKGFIVEAANTSQTGTTSYAIKDYIQDAYDTWDNPPEFICLVGDAGGSYSIPTSHYSSGEGDHYYTTLEGNDILADAFIGRLPFNDLYEFQTILNKIIKYETDPYTVSTHWFKKALLVGDPSHSGPSCVIVNKFIKEMILDNNGTFQFDEVYSSPFVTQISNSINSGVSYFSYRGWWGMSGWENYHTDNLTNGYMLPAIVIPTCGTGDFEGTSDGISEHFFKAGTPTTPKGAIAAVGTATLSTHTAFNNCLLAGVFNGIFAERIYNMGGALVAGKVNMYNCFPTNPNNWVDKFSYWNNLMGDPGMELWTNTPSQFNVYYDSQVPLGTNYFEITVKNANNQPISQALVTILKGNDEIFESQYTDNEGRVYVSLETANTGYGYVTVSKHDYEPYMGNFSIVQSSTFCNIYDFIIDDDTTGTSNGNDNGIINPGEQIELSVRLKNYGNNTLQNVAAEITTPTPLVTIIDDRELFNDIEPDSIETSLDDFDFIVDYAFPGDQEIIFDVEINTDIDDWNDRLYFTVNAPILTINDYIVLDNNNGILDPGETSEIVFTVQNIGTVRANGVTGILSSPDDRITVIDSIGYFGDIIPESSSTNNNNSFMISADTQIIPGAQIDLFINFSDTSYFETTLTTEIEIGEIFVTDPLGPDEYGYYCYDSGDTEYDACPIYDWIEIDTIGTDLNLWDNGDTGDITTITLPFSLSFYGINYPTMTVCSNGWIAPGTTEQYSFMNSPLPGPWGPSPMIAAFWDDLRTSPGDVYYYFNPSLHYFIVEWSNLSNDYNSAEETFQVIIYDSDYYPTPTGDCEILVQYKVVNNVNVGSYYSGYMQHGEYSSVGLENHTGTGGLEYTFSNIYPTAAKTLENNLALLFTTRSSEVLDPPIANITPEEFVFQVNAGGSAQDILSINNSGPSNLIYYIEKEYPQSDGSGGPDPYGYIWTDSNEPDGPEYEWVDISDIGIPLTFSHNDVAAGPFDLGFYFSFYGHNYNEFIVSPNGWIGFEDDWADFHNYSIPRIDAPKPAIFAFWDDLDPIQGGDVYYYSNGIDSLVVWYDDVIHFPGIHNGIYDFEVIITANGKIKIQYRDVSGDIDTNTIGIQNESGTIGLEVAYNENYVQNNLAVEIQYLVDWLTLGSSDGIVFPDSTDYIDVNVSAAELASGNIYNCDLLVSTNDPDNSLVTIPVTLEVDLEYGTVQGDVTLIGGGGNVSDVKISVGDYIVYPNASGNFEVNVPAGNYELVATLDDYDPDHQQIEVIANQTTNVYVTLEYVQQPENISVFLTEDYRVNIHWSPINQNKSEKIFQSYSLHRYYNNEWNTITENIIDTFYTDNLYYEDDGIYRYGIQALYEYTYSDTTISDTLSVIRFTPVDFYITLSDGGIPENVIVSINGLDTLYTQNFIDTTLSDGHINFVDVFMTNYSLNISKENYEPISEEIAISADSNDFYYELQSIHSSDLHNLPTKFEIAQNYPNPIRLNREKNNYTNISYQIPQTSKIKIIIYNIKGEKVRTLVNDTKLPGYHNTIWDGKSDNNIRQNSGIYLYELQVNEKTKSVKKCILIR